MVDQSTSALIPKDPFDQHLSRLMGLPNGAHTQPVVKQHIDFYGNGTSYIVQTVRHDDGDTTFVTQTSAQGTVRYILPPSVLECIERQRNTVSMMVRRTIGRRLADERKAAGTMPTFTPEMRKKAALTRKRNAAKKAARKR